MADRAPGASLALDWCQRHWRSLCHVVVLQLPRSGCWWQMQQRLWVKWIPNRIRHCLFVASLWTCVWLLGTWPLGRPLSEGWRFFIPVTAACRTGFTIAWTFFTNFNHSHWWNEFLALNPNRSYPVLSKVMACLLGGQP